MRTILGWRQGAAVMGLALVAACSDSRSDPFAPVTPAEVLRVTARTDQMAMVGTAVPNAPTVLVIDERGVGVAGVVVSFAVTAGGGTITGAAEQTTGNDGHAAIGGWVMGPEAGVNTLTATVAGLAPVTFTAAAVVAVPASIVATAGTGQRAPAGAAVATAPSVVVRDASGNPVPNVTVTFAVTSGNGTVTGAAARTDTAGAAAVGSWTLGDIGTNSLRATVAGVAPITFTAEALNPCAAATPHTVGTTSEGALHAGDCRFSSGENVDLFAVDSADYRVLSIGQTSDSINSLVYLYDRTGTIVGYDDDGDGSTRNASLLALVAPGRYTIGASSYSREAGPYRVTTQAAAAVDVANCRQVFVTPGITTSQRVESTDCAFTHADPYTGAVSTYYYDGYMIYLRAGQSITVDMTDPTLDTYLEIYDGGGRFIGADDNGGGPTGTTNARITFAPTFAGFYLITAGTNGASATGTYTLSVR